LALDQQGITKSVDSRRRLLPPRWKRSNPSQDLT
jgi:hypothetical protein